MAASKLSDLLPIPDGVNAPHAYQVFGLAGGESSAAIKAAVKKVYADLKAAKATTDPKLWKQAARLAESAKQTLSDPDMRAALNAGSAPTPSGLPPMGTPPAGGVSGAAPVGTAPAGMPPAAAPGAPADPLSGMLPPADPLAGMLPPSNPMAAQNPMGATAAAQQSPAPGFPQAPNQVHPNAHQQPGYPQQPAPQQYSPGPQHPAQQYPPAQQQYPPAQQYPPGQYPPGQQQYPPAQQYPPGQQQASYPQQPIAHPGQAAAYGQPLHPGAAAPVVPPNQAVPHQAAHVPNQQALHGQAVPNQQAVHGNQVAPTASAGPTAPVFKPKKSKRRRKKSGFGLFAFAAIALGVVIAVLAFVVLYKPDKQNNNVAPVAGSSDAQGAAAPKNQPRNKRPRKKQPSDPVMGDMAGDVEPPPQTTPTGLPVNQFSAPQDTAPQDEGSMGMQKPGMQDTGMQDTGMQDTGMQSIGMQDIGMPSTGMQDMGMENAGMPDPPLVLESPDIPGVSVEKPGVVQPAAIDPDAMLPIAPPTETSSDEMNQAAVEKAEAAIKSVKQLIRDPKWVEMKPAADRLTEMTLTPEQREQADALYNLADLATYYRGAVQRGLGTLQATQDFEVADGFRVIVVQVSTSSITILFNKRNKTYSIDELPFRLGEKIASFALAPDKPDSIAGKNIYQAISKQATDEHRTEAIESLTNMNGQVEEVDTKAVAEMIRVLFN